jgi:hypothetical protein
MKCSSIPKIIGTLLLIACCFANFNVFAHALLAREAHGVIQSINYQKQILTLTYAQAPGPQKLIWKSDTRENPLVREILKAKLPEPGGGCNVERSRMRRAIH